MTNRSKKLIYLAIVLGFFGVILAGDESYRKSTKVYVGSGKVEMITSLFNFTLSTREAHPELAFEITRLDLADSSNSVLIFNEDRFGLLSRHRPTSKERSLFYDLLILIKLKDVIEPEEYIAKFEYLLVQLRSAAHRRAQ